VLSGHFLPTYTKGLESTSWFSLQKVPSCGGGKLSIWGTKTDGTFEKELLANPCGFAFGPTRFWFLISLCGGCFSYLIYFFFLQIFLVEICFSLYFSSIMQQLCIWVDLGLSMAFLAFCGIPADEVSFWEEVSLLYCLMYFSSYLMNGMIFLFIEKIRQYIITYITSLISPYTYKV